MPRDTQIVLSATRGAPKDYTLPGSVELVLRTVQATFTDNGAASDWLPCVELISDSGHTIARAVDPDVKVTAGDDAKVTWFPGVKPARGGTGVTGIASGFFQGDTAGVPITLPSGVATKLSFAAGTDAEGSYPLFAASPIGTTDFQVTAARMWVQLTVLFPAANYDRYIEVNQSPGVGNIELQTPFRQRTQVSPDGDSMSIGCVVGGLPSTPSNLHFIAYQASGVARTVSAFCWAIGWPIPLPGKVWS